MRRVLAIALLAWVAVASAGTPPPADLNQRVGFDQHPGVEVPMGTRVTVGSGHPATLRQLADGKPLLLAFGYYRCPNLCDLTLHGMAKAVAAMSLQPSADYNVAFLSIDPNESATEAAGARAMLQAMEPAAQPGRWYLATAGADAIHALTRATGFRYFYDTRNQQFAHPSGLVVITPDGRIAQYFFGVTYDASALRLALVAASQGHIGGVIDQIVLFCCGYDPTTGRYSLIVSRLMMVLGCAFVLIMGLLWLRMRRRSG